MKNDQVKKFQQKIVTGYYNHHVNLKSQSQYIYNQDVIKE